MEIFGYHLSSDNAISLAAAFIALLSLGISLWQQVAQQKFNQLSLKPLPWFYVEEGDETKFHIDLYNHGEGPMIIVDTSFTNGKKTSKHIANVIPGLNARWTTLSPGKVIGADKTVTLWEMNFKGHSERVEDMREHAAERISNVTATITYKDIYGNVYPPHVRSFNFLQKVSEE